VVVTPIERLSLFAQAIVVSSQLESSFAGRNPGYHRIDLGGTVRLLERTGPLRRLELTLRIENVTDEKYEEVLGFRALGFSALAGLRAAF
jgi:outer membrane receptor protein involved in Fe transport